MAYLWIIYGLSTYYLRLIYILFTAYLWLICLIYSLSTANLQIIYGLATAYLWLIYRLPMAYLQITFRACRVIHTYYTYFNNDAASQLGWQQLLYCIFSHVTPVLQAARR